MCGLVAKNSPSPELADLSPPPEGSLKTLFVPLKDMLGKALLQLHDLHHYMTFFISLVVAIMFDHVD